MATEPAIKQAVAFFDGQNLFHAAREAFGHSYPNYEPQRLASRICSVRGWNLHKTCFYTGVPDIADDARWNRFWAAKLLAMSRAGVQVFSRSLRYRNHKVLLPDGGSRTVLVGEEKGIDVRIALDVVRMAHKGEFDVALVFSQGQDLSEVAAEIRVIASEQDRWIKMASAFPLSPTSHNRRGINRTDWITIDRAMYEACIDPRDYRPRPPNG